MKTIRSLIVAVVAGVAFNAAADSYTFSFTNGFANNGVIPDGNTTGWFDTRTLAGLGEPLITDVNVSLNLAGGYNGDLYAYLTHDSGFSVLLNRPGRPEGFGFGYNDAGLNLTLDDSAGLGDIHTYQATLNYAALISNGSAWSPDGRNANPLLVLTTDSRTHRLDQMNGLNPNGEWTLFVADVSTGEQATLVSWGLTIAAVPEPATGALIGLGTLGLILSRRHR